MPRPAHRKSLWRLAAAVLLVGLGILGLLLSVAGVAGCWVAWSQLVPAGERACERAEGVLAVAADTLNRTRGSLEQARGELTAVPRRGAETPKAESVGMKLSTRDKSLRTLTGKLFPDLQQAGGALEASAAGAVVVSSLLEGLEGAALLEKTSLDADQLRDAAERVNHLGTTARQLSALLDGGTPDAAEVDGQVAKMEQGIREALTKIDELSGRVGEVRSRVAVARGRVRPWR